MTKHTTLFKLYRSLAQPSSKGLIAGLSVHLVMFVQAVLCSRGQLAGLQTFTDAVGRRPVRARRGRFVLSLMRGDTPKLVAAFPFVRRRRGPSDSAFVEAVSLGLGCSGYVRLCCV